MTSCSRALPLLLLLGQACQKPTAPEVAVESALAAAPQAPRAALEQGAASLDVSVRARALELLVRLEPAPGGGAWGPRALYDPSPSVQRAAAMALADRLPEAASAGLLAAFVARPEADPYVVGAAALRLSEAGHTDTLPALQARLAAERAHWRRAPLALAAARMGDAEAERALSEALGRGDFPLEIDFFLACGRSGIGGLVPALEQAAPRVEEELVLPIAGALLLLGARSGEALFREALDADRVEQRMEALDYLALIETPASLELLRRARAGGPAPVRDYARLIAVAWGMDAPDFALEALGAADREQRQQAARALGEHLARATELPRRDRKRVLDALASQLADPEVTVVLEVLRALGRVGGPEQLASLDLAAREDPPLALEVELAGARLMMGAR